VVQLKSGKAAQFHREFATNRADDDCMTMVTRRACGLQPRQGAWTARSSLHGEWLAIRHVKAMEISRSLTHCRQLVSQEERIAADRRGEAEKKGAATHQKEVGVRLFINN